jgi:hypothetical protein
MLIGDGLKMYQDAMTAEMTAQLASTEDPVEKALAAYMQRSSGQWVNMFRPSREGATLTFFRIENSSTQQQLVTTAVIGVLVALLLPAIQAAREAARRNQSMSHMRLITLAMLNYESAMRRFPPHANYDANGQPLLSWRVHILPYIEEGQLYSEFHLDEPWDSEHNKKLIPRMPAVFANPNSNTPPELGMTNYLAVVGPECAINGTAEGKRISQITDGASRTIAIVEANDDQAVTWTKPADFEFRAADPAAGLSGMRQGGFLAGFCDGHTELVRLPIPAETLAAFFTANGRELIPDLPQ